MKRKNSIDAYWHQQRISSAHVVRQMVNQRAISRKQIHNYLKRLTKKGSLTLDVGCGLGLESIMLARMGRCVVSLDYSKQAIVGAREMARNLGTEINLILADACYLPFKEKIFDFIFSLQMLHYFPNIVTPLVEQRRILKDNGFILVDLPYTFSTFTIIKHLLLFFRKWPWGFEKQYSVNSLKRALSCCGFVTLFVYHRESDPVLLKLTKALSKFIKLHALNRILIELFSVNIGIIGVKC